MAAWNSNAAIRKKMILSSEVGFMTQPYGGTHHVTDLDFGPILYIALGVVR